MGVKKAAAILALEGAKKSEWYIKRQLRHQWTKLPHSEWVKFCKSMAGWLSTDAPNEWDEVRKANTLRKARNDKAALEALITASGPGKFGKRLVELQRLKALLGE